MRRKFDIDDALVVGGALVTGAGVWLIYPPAALIAFGLALLFMGIRGSQLGGKG